jgi:hypothetical protein
MQRTLIVMAVLALGIPDARLAAQGPQTLRQALSVHGGLSQPVSA